MFENDVHASPDYPIEGARTYFSGGGGLVSTASDYARFLQMLLNGGELAGVRLLSPKSVELMTVDHVGHREAASGMSFGLGFGIRQELGRHGELGSRGTYDWGGYWGTSFWVDPQEQLIGILLTQINPSNYNHERFRTLVYQAITESVSAVRRPRFDSAMLPSN
jgi:CubicO group peptidase (beta-lactamase class C family)